MSQIKKSLFLFVFSILSLIQYSNAQIIEYGLNFNYLSNKLIVKEDWASDIFMREAAAGSGYGLGFYFFQREPKDYNKRGLDLKYGFLIEGDGCICTSNINIAIKTPNSLPSLSDLKFRMYRLDFSPKLTVHQRRFGLGLGPKITRITYAEYSTNRSDDTFSATADFYTMSYGFESSFFYDAGGIKLSLRYARQLTSFKKAIVRRPTDIGNRQFMLSLSFKLIDKSKGINHDSIIWD